jgi:hypothetical protein
MEMIPNKPLSKDRWAAMRRSERALSAKPGTLVYGDLDVGVVNCRVLGLSETGVRVETNVMLNPTPESFSLEFSGIYCLARRRWAVGREIGLEFIFD